MSRKAAFLAVLIVSAGAFATAHAADAALFSNAGQLDAGKAKLAAGGISGVAGTPVDSSFAAQRTVTFSGGDLFAAPAGASASLANPDLVAKLSASGHSFKSGTVAGLATGEHKDGAFSRGGAAGLTGGEAKDGTFSAGGAVGLTEGTSANRVLQAGLAARAAVLSQTK